MRTVRISRQGFSNHGMHSWIRFFIFVLSKKYNVIVDPINPDLVLYSNIYYSSDEEDTFLKCKPQNYDYNDTNKKFLFVSGELAEFQSMLSRANHWSIGYQTHFNHPKYLRQPSGVMDVWTLFDESRLTDSPFEWLTTKRNFDLIKSRNNKFCSITQASHNDFRKQIFDKLNEYKKVISSGPWEQNIEQNEELNRYQWHRPEYKGRIDGLTYREKIEFFQKYKFNISIHFTNTPDILQEKIFHAYFSGAIPIFYGNPKILNEGFNPETFINLHDYQNLDDFLNLVKQIDNNDNLYRKYIESPIYVDNKLPVYMDFDYTLNFLEKIIES